MGMLLIESDFDYSDEFSVTGFIITTEDGFEETKAFITKYFNEHKYVKCDGVEMYFGTNEALQFGSASEVLDCLQVTKLTTGEAHTIANVLGDSYGIFNLNSLVEGLRNE